MSLFSIKKIIKKIDTGLFKSLVKENFLKEWLFQIRFRNTVFYLNVQGTQKERFRRPRAVNKAKLERADYRGVLLEQTRGHNWKEETQQVYAAVSGLIKLTESVIGFIFIWLTLVIVRKQTLRLGLQTSTNDSVG